MKSEKLIIKCRCLYCDTEFDYSIKRKKNKFCTLQCWRLYTKKFKLFPRPRKKKENPKSVCEQCGKEFEVVNGRGKFCTLECYHESLKTLEYKPKNCLYCGKSFISKQKSKKQIDSNKYCSKLCKGNYLRITQQKGTYKNCLSCNKLFYVKKCFVDCRFCSRKCAYDYKRGKPNPKASITSATIIANGTFNPKRNFYKQGWYHSTITNEDEWFGSSYEEKRMHQLDKLGVNWTKKHKIRIPYVDIKGDTRNYVPDFLVDGKIIEEVKPSGLKNSTFDNNIFKKNAAIEYCKVNGYEYRTITEKELKETDELLLCKNIAATDNTMPDQGMGFEVPVIDKERVLKEVESAIAKV